MSAPDPIADIDWRRSRCHGGTAVIAPCPLVTGNQRVLEIVMGLPRISPTAQATP
jgi:hypothetical protein